MRDRSWRTSSSACAPRSGPNARIVAANRIRKGGVGGFFARQAYEVLVEPADAPMPAPAPTRQSRRRPHPLRRPRLGPRRRPGSVHAPTSILELADAVSADERNEVIDLVEERTLSTQSRDFAQVLDQFSRSIDMTPDELEREAAPAGGPVRRADEIDLRPADRGGRGPSGTRAPARAASAAERAERADPAPDR